MIITPFLFFENEVLFDRDVEVARTAILFLKLLHCWSLLLDPLEHSIRNKRWPVDIVTLLGLGDMQPVHDSFVLLWVLSFLSEAMIEKDVASLTLHISNSIA